MNYKNQVILIFGIVFFFSCKSKIERNNIHLKYFEFENDLKSEFLNGNIKEVYVYRTHLGKDKKRYLLSKTVFGKNGNYIKKTEFDLFENKLNEINYYYKENGLFKKSVNENFISKTRVIETYNYDSIKKEQIITLKLNDSLEFKSILKYDKTDNISEEIKIKNRDTTKVDYNIELNSYGEITRKEILEKDIKTIYVYEFKNNGSLLSQTTKTEFMKLKSIYHYTSNYLSKIEHYESINNSDLKLKSIIKYDENFNALNEKYFENSNLTREVFNIYEFDNNRNWTKRIVSQKQYNNSKKNEQLYTETRKINYW